MDYLNDPVFKSLNREQQNAALAGNGAYLVIAGPGTGKTHTMTARTHFLVQSGVQPENILLMTFTKKAANEIRDRLTAMNPEYGAAHTGTFHSIALRILQRFGGRKPIIIDEDDEKDMLDKWIRYRIKPAEKEQFRLDGKPLDFIFSAYRQRSYRKGENPVWSWVEQDADIDLEEFNRAFLPMIRSSSIPGMERKGIDDVFADICRTFDEAKFMRGKLSFDDCIIAATRFLNESGIDPGYFYVSVDEFQDSDKSQLEFVKALARPHGNIFAVGDDKQSIYCWRGAYPEIFDDFRRTFADRNLCEINLVQNYRSTAKIIDLVNSAAAARPRHSERLVPTGKIGVNPTIFQTRDAADLTFKLINSRLAKGESCSDIAVLYRGHFGASPDLQLKLAEAKIPFVVIGGKAITDRLIFKRFRDCLRIVQDPAFSTPFSHLLKLFPSIGDKAASQLSDYLAGAAENGGLEAAVFCLGNGCPPRNGMNISPKLAQTAREWVLPFLLRLARGEDGQPFGEDSAPGAVFDRIMPMLAGLCFFKNRKAIAEYMEGLEKYGCASWTQMDPHVRDQLGSSLRVVIGAIDTFSARFSSAADWLEALSFDDNKDDTRDKLVLSTIHGAKGKEWKTVVLGECNDSIFFSKRYREDLRKRYARSGNGADFYEWSVTAPETTEILNLFYVALSRAKNQCAIVKTGDFKLVDELMGHGMRTARGEYYVSIYEALHGLQQAEGNLLLADREKLAQYREANRRDFEMPDAGRPDYALSLE